MKTLTVLYFHTTLVLKFVVFPSVERTPVETAKYAGAMLPRVLCERSLRGLAPTSAQNVAMTLRFMRLAGISPMQD